MDIARQHYTLLLAICASLFATPLMLAGVNAVLPEIGHAFNASAATLALVGAAYSLGLAIFQLATGSLGDIAGHRRIFLAGALLFAIASAIAAVTPQMAPFLILRFLQGVGGAMLSASGLALIASCAPHEHRASYLGISGAAVYAGIACGPPLAGFVTSLAGWRWIFWINALANIGVYCIMKFKVRQEWRPASNKSFDWQGALLYGLSMTSLTMAVSGKTFSQLFAWASFILFIIFGALFILREKTATYPVLDLRLLGASRVLRFSSFAALLNYSSLFGLLFYFSFYLQVALKLDVRQTGLVLAIQSLTQALVTPLATRLCKKIRLPLISASGAALCGAGIMAAAFLETDSSLFLLVFSQILNGSGIAFFSLANTTIIIDSGGKQAVGQTAALTGAMRTAGQLFSMILITLSVSWFLGTQPINVSTLAGFMQSMKMSLIIFGLFNIAGITLSLAQNKSAARTG